MQPETKQKVKAIESEPKISPVEQWDQVAFKLIQDTLAPKGYKQITNGRWRGLRIVNAEQPGIVKSKVTQCQRISAQLVRTYRDKVRIEIEGRIANLDKWIKEEQAKLKACRFWQFKRKAELKGDLRSLFGQAGSLQHLLRELDNIGIK